MRLQAFQQARQVVVLVGAVDGQAGLGLGLESAEHVAQQVQLQWGVLARCFQRHGLGHVAALDGAQSTDEEDAQVALRGQPLWCAHRYGGVVQHVGVRRVADARLRKVALHALRAVVAGRQYPAGLAQE